MAVKRLELSAETADMLRRPIRGQGGFQRLMRRVQAGLSGQRLDVSDDDINALIHATSGRQIGGFQRRARAIIVDAVCQLREDGRPVPAKTKSRARVLLFHQRRLPFGGTK